MMRTLLGRMSGMLAVGLLFSAGRAWGFGDSRIGQAAAQKQPKAKVGALIELLSKRERVIGICGLPYVESKGVVCRTDNSESPVLTGQELRGSAFVIMDVPGDGGYLVYKPFVTKEAKTVEDLEKAGAIVSREEILQALEKAWFKLRLRRQGKAVENLKKRLEAAGSPFDSIK